MRWYYYSTTIFLHQFMSWELLWTENYKYTYNTYNIQYVSAMNKGKWTMQNCQNRSNEVIQHFYMDRRSSIDDIVYVAQYYWMMLLNMLLWTWNVGSGHSKLIERYDLLRFKHRHLTQIQYTLLYSLYTI